MVPRFRHRRSWPLRLAAIFATSGIVALGFKVWLEDRRSAHLAAEVRALRAPRADDNWTYCTSTIARDGGGGTGATPPEAFRRSFERGFRAFEVGLAAPADVPRLVELARAHPTAHWLVVQRGEQRGTLEALAEALLPAPAVLDRIHPVLHRPEDLAYALRVYPFPSVVYAPTERGRQTVAAALFARDAGVAVVVLPRETFTHEVAAALAAVGARAYVAGVNDSAEARQFRDWGAAGVVTDSLEPRVTCSEMMGGEMMEG